MIEEHALIHLSGAKGRSGKRGLDFIRLADMTANSTGKQLRDVERTLRIMMEKRQIVQNDDLDLVAAS